MNALDRCNYEVSLRMRRRTLQMIDRAIMEPIRARFLQILCEARP